ncbi:MAG: dNTP triphosphohydrolase [Akkermansia sp.]|nr:dNTP triphosphohydrolase [Akkermansia sp.]
MEWQQLLSTERLSGVGINAPGRSAFNSDYGRVLYSSAFRRLQDKTQVFPLGRNDYVRTRLTHSLEVSNVGRALANDLADIAMQADGQGADPLLYTAMGDVVATACLAHDIGNPPFGHSGETAIDEAVAEAVHAGVCPEEFAVFRFEGNAQGFRLLSRTCDPIRERGLDLTAATLGAFTKYPCPQGMQRKGAAARYKKFGISTDDLPAFVNVAAACGLPALGENVWARHPLVFLMEAADDVSYLIADVEDAYVSGIITYDEVIEQLSLLGGFDEGTLASIARERVRSGASAAVRYTRARAVGACIRALRETMQQVYPQMMQGELLTSLMNASPMAEDYRRVQSWSVQHIYSHESVLRIEITGFNVIKNLMQLFLKWVSEPQSALGRKIGAILHADSSRSECARYRFLHVIDYISGMTDSYALQTHGTLFGSAPI